MQELTVLKSNLVMTSKDLAEITGKNHSDIMRDIRREVESLGKLAESIFALGSYLDKNNQSRPLYEFGKKGAMQLALKYDAVTRFKVIEKLEELERSKNNNLPSTYLEALKQLVASEEEKQILKQQLLEHKPKLEYIDEILKSIDTLTITQIAKDYGLTGSKLNKILHEKRIQYKQSNTWLLYNKYAGLGYTKSDTYNYIKSNNKNGSKLNTKWTQKGRLFIHNLLKDMGILANMDKEA